MRLTYDSWYNIAYIRFQEKQATVESVRVSDELIVDMAPDGTVYGILTFPLCCFDQISCWLPRNTP